MANLPVCFEDPPEFRSAILGGLRFAICIQYISGSGRIGRRLREVVGLKEHVSSLLNIPDVTSSLRCRANTLFFFCFSICFLHAYFCSLISIHTVCVIILLYIIIFFYFFFSLMANAPLLRDATCIPTFSACHIIYHKYRI